MKRLIFGATLLTIVILSAKHRPSAPTWGDRPSAITTSEFLELQLKLEFNRPETTAALNNFSIVQFCPSADPQTALVVIVQTYNDSPAMTKEDVRREIRAVGDSVVHDFQGFAKYPPIASRWPLTNPTSHILVRHVRASDLRETLAVTLDGETRFDADAFAQSEQIVKTAGGLWNW